jgi:hypothetical protein
MPSGFARYLEHDEKVVAHFDVRSCSAAVLKDRTSQLSTVEDVVLHLDPAAPSQALRIARWLVNDAGVAPEHLLAVTTVQTEHGTDGIDALADLGVPARNLILESEVLTSARRLVVQLNGRRNDAVA